MSLFDDDEALFEDIYDDDTSTKTKAKANSNEPTEPNKDEGNSSNDLGNTLDASAPTVASTTDDGEPAKTEPEEPESNVAQQPVSTGYNGEAQNAEPGYANQGNYQPYGNQEYGQQQSTSSYNQTNAQTNNDSYYDNGQQTNQFRPSNMGKDSGKMFIGGLNWDTTDEGLSAYFSKYGEILDLTIMKDSNTGRSRGFGFLTFKDPKSVDEVIKKDHILDGKLIDPKRAIAKDEQERVGKIFVGGIDPMVNEKDFNDFFSQFGRIVDAQLMIDKDTGRSRGFGFITFDTPEAVDRCCVNKYLTLKGKSMEVKRAQPRGQHQQNHHQQQKQMQNQYAPYANAYGQYQMPMGPGMPTMPGATPEMMQEYWQRMQWYMYQQQQQQQSGEPDQNEGGNEQGEEEPLNPQQQVSHEDYDNRDQGQRAPRAPSGNSGRYDRTKPSRPEGPRGERNDYQRGRQNDRDDRNMNFPKGPRGPAVQPPSGPSGQAPSGPSGQRGYKKERYHPYGRKNRR